MRYAARVLVLGFVALVVGVVGGPGLAVAAPTRGADTVQVVVDAPAPGSRVAGPVLLQGWAADPASATGSGVQRVAVYRDGPSDGGGAYLGEARYGQGRTDVARALGASRFGASGYALPLALPPGPHTLYVYAQTADGWSAPTTVALDAGPQGTVGAVPGASSSGAPPQPQIVTGTPPPPHCLGLPTPFGPFGGLETPQSYGAIYPPDVPLVFGDPAFWLTYGNPNGAAYIDLQNGSVYTNSYFYQPRPARGILTACP